ncbi:laccase-7 isoform X2 [Ziziphus jujuba]|uniref:Laccase-7 isoform X2 n=1 Tax=Ziziphus jujuba TaxID=326968 RepID=A0A6P6GK53_ZIZJJ|nr:laccase-7 isoform X2 [Ziziphus jujuba]
MNNESFQLPNALSLLDASFFNVSGIYTSDLPDQPSVKFDCTKLNPSTDPLRLLTQKSTKLKKLKFNSTVEIVFQNTAILGIQSHPMRLHGFNFHVYGSYTAIWKFTCRGAWLWFSR